MSTQAWTDGGNRGNPGLAAYGVYIQHEGQVIQLKQVLAVKATNNVAEYCGLIAALRWARDQQVRTLHVRSDSQLMVYQVEGKYQIRNAQLVVLHREVTRLMQDVGDVTLEYIPREFNKEADRLCREAMDAAQGK